MDREQFELSDALAPDRAINTMLTYEAHRTNEELSSQPTVTTQVFPKSNPNSVNAPDKVTACQDDSAQLSGFPDAPSWRDYVHQYWNADPERHQYRAGQNFSDVERKKHQSRLSRMKLIAEYVRHENHGDIDSAKGFYAYS